MQIANDTNLVEISGWYLRIRQPVDKSSNRVLLLLHGWSGDENSMWLFAKDIPTDYWVIAPRAPFSAGNKGYSWREVDPGKTWGIPDITEFQMTISSLLGILEDWANLNSIKMNKIDLIGFSQGAALVCAILLLEDQRISKAACLAGFMPEGGKTLVKSGILKSKKIFVSHGLGDEIIPLRRGQEMVRLLKFAGADVELCSEDVGHKVGIHCYQGLKKFFSE